jgi:hypothetical protein
VKLLETNQTKYNYEEDSILEYICSNSELPVQVLQWLLSNYPDSILNYFEDILVRLDNSVCSMEKYILIIDHIVKGNLYWKFKSGCNIIHWTILSKPHDIQGLNYLYHIDPQLDIRREDIYEESPLFDAIFNS